MAIRIEPFWDPLSETALNAAADSLIVMQSEAGRILRQELERYCAGQTQGRSFLIAGHRGAGKTTMVADAIRRVRQSYQPQNLRPLAVFLHGPSLFEVTADDDPATPHRPARPPAPAPTASTEDAAQTAAAAPQKSTDEETPPEIEARRAMVQIMLGLHRAVAQEFAIGFRSRVRALATPSDGSPPIIAAADAAELAAQFEVELLEDPPASRLREFFTCANATDDGVLFPQRRATFGQGARELVALNGVCNAHQRISGDLSRKEQQKAERSRSWERKRVVEIKGAEVFKPIAAMLAGAIVAGGTAVTSGFGFGTAMVGLLTALFASVVINRTTTSSEKQERQTDTVFIPDLSLRTLDRVMPVLLERLRAAGLAPIIIVDELDKVPELSMRISAAAKFLKKLMAENVFSCFLADRSYIEQLRIAERRQAYARTYSYFSHTLLIAYHPNDFDDYLSRMLVLPEVPEKPPNAPDDGTYEDSLDLDVLKWVLRHRSELHALRLSRELASIRGDQNLVRIGGGRLRSMPAFQLDLTLQVAIELELNRIHVRDWLARRPTMVQTVFDALHYLPRHLMSGNTAVVFQLGKDGVFGVLELGERLEERMNLQEALRPQPGASVEALNPDDLVMFQTIVFGMASMLSQDSSVDTFISAWDECVQSHGSTSTARKPSVSVMAELLVGQKSPLVREQSEDGNTVTFSWRYFSSSALRAVRPQDDISVEQAIAQAKLDLEFIDQVEANLWTVFKRSNDPETPQGTLLSWLAGQPRVLSTNPTWMAVQSARNDITTNRSRLLPPVLLDACELITRYRTMLAASVPTLVGTVLNAAFLAGVSPTEGPGAELIRLALLTLSRGLRFSELTLSAIGAANDDFQVGVLEKYSARTIGSPLNEGTAPELQTVGIKERAQQSFLNGAAARASLDWDVVTAAAWDQLFLRAIHFVRTGKDRRAEVPEILCTANGRGPAIVVDLNLNAVTLHGWTTVLLSALPSDKPHAQSPAWMGVIALRQLGIQCLGSAWTAQFQKLLLQIPQSPSYQAKVSKLLDEEGLWRGSANTAAQMVVVVRRSRSSLTNGWTAMPTRGLALVVNSAQASTLESFNRLLNLSPEAHWTVAWEQPPDSDGDQELLRASISERTESRVVHAWLYPEDGPNLQQPSIIFPKGADDLLSRIGSMTPPPQPAPPQSKARPHAAS